jgi:hypothetical protein
MIADIDEGEVLSMLTAASYPSTEGNGLPNACYI